MKKVPRIAFYIALGALLATTIGVMAQGEIPEGVQIFDGPGGLICFVWPDGSGECYCPCEPSECEPTPEPTATPEPRNTPTPEPKDTPTPEPEPTPTPEPECFQWLCHKPGTSAEQDYCCDSQGCVDAHLAHGDYLGKCK